MYNLVIGVIAGVIFGVLAVAGAWYGGAVYERARLRSELVTVVGQQQQIAAALDLYETNGGRVSSLGDDDAALAGLLESGLLHAPPPGTWRTRRSAPQRQRRLRRRPQRWLRWQERNWRLIGSMSLKPTCPNPASASRQSRSWARSAR